MTQAITSVEPIRAITSLPKVQAAVAVDPQPEVVEPQPVQRSVGSSLASAQLEAAIAINRSNTPPELAEQRTAPRYSLRELNALTPEQLRTRLQQINPSDDRPGWVKVLDIIDMPRNFIANVVTDEFIPEAKRMAMERGEFDQAGQVKVYGSDVLRAMGVKNNLVSGIGGFFVDVFTDPLSWLGGPIGGLKNVGTRGAVQLSNQGRRTINSAINAVRNGGMVSDAYATRLIKTTLDDAVARGVTLGDTLVADLDNVGKAQYLRTALLGSGTGLGDAAEKVGLGRFTKGGYISDDVYKVVTNAAPSEAARISAVKDYVARYTNNGVFDLTKGKGGAEILHVPFSSRGTLTVPSFRIPLTQAKFGKQAELQIAAAAVREGNPAKAQAVLDAIAHTNRVSEISTKMERVASDLVDARRSDDEILPYLETHMAGLESELKEAMAYGASLRANNPGNIEASLKEVDDLGTLFATMDMYEQSAVQARHAEALMKWQSAEGDALRFTKSDIGKARRYQELIREEAKAKSAMDMEGFAEALIDPSRRTDEFDKIVKMQIERAGMRYRELIELPSDQLDILDRVADGFHEHVAAAHQVSNVYKNSIRGAMHSDAAMLADAAKMMLKLSDPDLGHMPLMSFAKAFEKFGFDGMASRTRNLGESIATNLGGVKGNVPDVMRYVRGKFSNATHIGGEIAHDYRRQIEAAMRQTDTVRPEDYDRIAELAGLMLEQKMINRAATQFPETANQMADATLVSQTNLAKAMESGLLRDKQLMTRIDEISESVADLMEQVAIEAIQRGDFDNPLAAYVPVMLKREAARRANIARSQGKARQADLIASAGGPADLDPTKRRITNMVRFTDPDGKEHAFTIAEANAYQGVDAGTLAARQGRERRFTEEVLEGIEAYKRTFGTNATGDALIENMQARSRMMVPSELNTYAETGRLDPIVGGVIRTGDNGREFFETNIVNLVYNRMRANEVAKAKDSLKDIVDEFAIARVSANELNKTTIGEAVQLATGEVAENLGDGRIRIGNRNYTHISALKGKFGEDTLFDPTRILRGDSEDIFIPDTLATEMIRLGDTLRPERIGPIMQAAESITNLFRTTTLLHPSWAVTNSVGNTILAAMGGSFNDPKRAAKFMGYMRQAAMAHFRRNADQASDLQFIRRGVNKALHKLGSEPGTTSMVAGAPMRMDDILRLADAGGVTGAGRAADAIEANMRQNAKYLPGLMDDVAEKGVRGAARRLADTRQAARAGHASNKLKRGVDSAYGFGAALPTDLYRRSVNQWFQANATIDDVFRTAFFMQMLDDGLDPISAAARTRDRMLNFGDMTSFERNNIRPLVPFYAWMRASLPAFVMKGIKDPKLLSAVPKIQQGMEEMFAGEDRLPRHMRPRWLQETMGLQIGTDPETRKAILAGTLLPQEGALQVATAIGGGLATALDADGAVAGFDGNDFMEGVNWLFAQTSPSVRLPIELAAGKELFSKRTIGVREGDADITMQDYFLNQLRPVKEYGLGLRQGEVEEALREQGYGAAASRLSLGGRVQRGLQEDRRRTSIYFEMKDEEASIRKAIRLAEKRGDDERVTNLKLDLLGNYKTFIDRIGDESAYSEIPRWAAEDLRSFLGSAPSGE